MDYLPFLLYVFSLCAGLGSVYVLFKLLKRYQLKYLSYYMYFLISYYLLGFLNLIARQLAVDLIGPQTPQVMGQVIYLMAFLAIPFFVISIYFFMLLIQELLERKISSLFTKVYLLFWTAFFMVIVYAMKNYFDTNNEQYLRIFFPYLSLVGIVSFLIIPVYLILGVRRLPESRMKKVIRNFGIIYVVCFGLCTIISSNLGLKYLGSYGAFIAILFFFLENWPPLLYLKYGLEKYYVEPQAQSIFDLNLSSFYKKFQISTREQEIINLILNGKSNTEIEKELFISLHTVKNHIYNIYQKLGVKSRLQLTNCIRDYLGNNGPLEK